MIKTGFSQTLFGILILMLISSCRNEKTTESVISNQTDYDFTIYFSSYGKGDFIKANTEKIIHVGYEDGNNLQFPFESDTVKIEIHTNSKVYYFAESNMEEEFNIFDVYNWTYVNYTNKHTKATYTFTNTILSNMDELLNK